ncbi:sterol desaturase family protein [Aestuariibacter salexigens]|uniref:sterol desaturase family protein n=1 Tax=Aestuariibacter salexigens TaxID=226010 RepID=UPI0004280F0C|nr:sterol desaturase family protein [Aestuariibacter salexigens]
MTIILFAIPFFFLLIGIELIAEKWKGTHYYRVNDAVNSLSIGVLSRMTGILKQLLPFTLYVIVYEHSALYSFSDSLWVWVVAFVLYDFFYYWNHRLGHEVSVLWAAHVVHHSSEEYNLTTALRQTSGALLTWVFFLPLAVIGFDPMMIVSVAALNLVYQFWVHTRHVPKLGWFEWFFVSPSNHRVHHAQNEIYLDKNYGGVFIIWDRLFGTFQEELDSEAPIYGVRKSLNSWNPLWANMQVYGQLISDSWHTARWQDKLRVWFGRTGWRPEDVAEKYPMQLNDLQTFKKFDVQMDTATKWYAVFQLALSVVIAVMFMIGVQQLTLTEQVTLAGFMILSSATLGWKLEMRPIANWLEGAKNLTVLMAGIFLPVATWLSVTLVVLSAICLVLLALSALGGDHSTQEKSLPAE